MNEEGLGNYKRKISEKSNFIVGPTTNGNCKRMNEITPWFLAMMLVNGYGYIINVKMHKKNWILKVFPLISQMQVIYNFFIEHHGHLSLNLVFLF
jgi:hypothetical protein